MVLMALFTVEVDECSHHKVNDQLQMEVHDQMVP